MRRLALAFLGVPLVLLGCGGGSMSSPPPPPPSPPPSFTLNISANTLFVIAGDQTRLTVSVVPQNGFSASVSLSITGLPSGVTGTFTQNPLPASQTSDLIIQAAVGVAPQNASLQVRGSSGSLSNSQAVTLNVVSQPAGTPPRSSYISMDGPLHEIVYDPMHKLVFAANPQLNEVEVISTTTRQRMTPLPIPQPWTLDVTPEGSRLWVG